jgi:DNA-directed RNA polymerase subunit alpha
MLSNQEVSDMPAAAKYLGEAQLARQRGDRTGAIEKLEAAYAADPDNTDTCFQLAYELDLVGEEDEAIHLYEQTVQTPTPALNALLNLAVLYEDRGEYDKAERCVRQVLTTDPTHDRAKLFIMDIMASKNMQIDEEEDERMAKHHALLDTPVTDFDLSVRARNALRKMNVRVLGDLLRVTEVELRSFKNFGEASLDEIKVMLAQRGLRLGQAVDQQHTAAKQAIYEQLEDRGSESGQSLNESVNELQLSVRARKALALLNIQSLGDLCARTEAELMGVKNFGMTSLLEIKEKLATIDLGLRRLED